MANMIKFCEPTMNVVLRAEEGGETATLKAVLNRIGRKEAKELLEGNPSFETAVEDFFSRVVGYPEVPYGDGTTGNLKVTDQDTAFADLTSNLLDSQVWCRAAFEAYVRALHGLPDLDKEADLGN